MLLAAFHNILWRCLSGQEFLYLLSKPVLEYCILLCLAELHKRLQPDGGKVLIKMMWQLTCRGKKFLKEEERREEERGRRKRGGRKREEGGREEERGKVIEQTAIAHTLQHFDNSPAVFFQAEPF